MKIICDNCRTKYSIADEKVKGKVFKIRCKKCQNIIVVRGTQDDEGDSAAEDHPAADDFSAGAGEYKETPGWHLVIGREQVGPMSEGEVRERFSRGEVDAETFTWREGFSDWVRLATIEDFADMTRPTVVASASDRAGPLAEQPSSGWAAGLGGSASPNEGLDRGRAGDRGANSWDGSAGAWSAPAQGAVRAEAAPIQEQPTASSGGGDLFSLSARQEAPAQDRAAGPFGGGPGEARTEDNLFKGVSSEDSEPSAAGSNGGRQLFPADDDPGGGKMKGARHENSVLFSLSNLQALAMGGKPAAASPAPTGAPVSGSDGSGLIDIRSMAGGGGASAGAAPGHADDLPDLGGFSAPISAAPILMPSMAEERPPWLLPTIIGIGSVLVIAIVVLAVVLATRKPEQIVVAAAPTAATGAIPPPPSPSAAKAVVAAEKKAEQPGAADTKGTPSAEPGGGKRKKGGALAKRKGAGGGRKEASEPTPAVAAPLGTKVASRTGTKAGARKPDALDDLIDGAISGNKPRAAKAKPAAAAEEDPSLPSTLSRGDIQGGMQKIKARVQACYDRYKVPGMATVKVSISPKGTISSAIVKGIFGGTPTGACVTAAVRTATFQKFRGAPINIEYPFVLR